MVKEVYKVTNYTFETYVYCTSIHLYILVISSMSARYVCCIMFKSMTEQHSPNHHTDDRTYCAHALLTNTVNLSKPFTHAENVQKESGWE